MATRHPSRLDYANLLRRNRPGKKKRRRRRCQERSFNRRGQRPYFNPDMVANNIRCAQWRSRMPPYYNSGQSACGGLSLRLNKGIKPFMDPVLAEASVALRRYWEMFVAAIPRSTISHLCFSLPIAWNHLPKSRSLSIDRVDKPSAKHRTLDISNCQECEIVVMWMP